MDIKPKTEKDLVARWTDRIATAKRFQDDAKDESGWDRFIDQYNKGDYQISLGTRRARIPAPPIFDAFAFVQSDISGLYAKDPYFTVVPKKNASVRGAAILEAAVNYWWRELKVKDEEEDVLVDSDVIGHGWIKDGYVTETEETESGLQIKSEGMFVNYVNWKDIVFSPSTQKIGKDSLWMAHRIIKPLQELKEKYPSLAKYEGTTHPRLSEKNSKNTLFKEDIQVGVLWEVWDAQEKKIYLLADGHDRMVRPPRPWPEYLEEYPFTPLWWYQKIDNVYPMSPLAPIESQAKEEIKLFAQMLNHIKRWNRQVIIKKGILSEDDMDRFEEGVDGAILEAQIPQGSLGDFHRPMDFGQLPTDIYMALDRLGQKKREVSGQPEFARGGYTKTSSRTLGELEAISEGAKTRQDKRVDRFETHMETVARHMIAHMKANFDVEQMAKIVDETPQVIIEAFQDKYNQVTNSIIFTKEDIQGEYDVDVKAGSTLPMNKSVRMAILKDVLQLASQIKGPVPPFMQVVIVELLREYQLPQLKAAFEQQEAEAEKAGQMGDAGKAIEEAKVIAEAEKRKAQANKIDMETALLEKQMGTPDNLQEVLDGLSVR